MRTSLRRLMRIPLRRLMRAPLRRLRLPRRTARLRLTLLYGAAFLVCGAGVLAFTYLLYGQTSTFSLPLNGGTAHAAARAVLRTRSADVVHEGPDLLIKAPPGVRQLGPYRAEHGVFKVPAADVQQDGNQDVLEFSFHRPIRYVEIKIPASAVQLLDGEINARVSVERRQILTISAVALAVIAVAAGGIGWILAGRVLRPLSTITSAARRIVASNLHERLALHGPDDELKELADTLDNLLARLEAAFDAQRRFAANASHELRTPLTRERTLLQVTLADPASSTSTWRAVSRELLASNAEQERLIESLLTLASSEGAPGEREPLDLAAITSEALAVPRPGISRLRLNVHADIEPAALDGEPLLIQQLVTNLIDNAVTHNIPGGDVRVATWTGDGHAVLAVGNSGRVIKPAEVDRLFQPFQRAGPRSARRDGGHGLGLSIVRAIAMAHGAIVTARPRPGGGLAIDVAFLPSAVRHQPLPDRVDFFGLTDGGVA
jgi:signal transduction histidine kinase